MEISYKDKTYEKIKERVLNSITNTLDKREGSFINDMVSPYCQELEDLYSELPFMIGTMFLVDAEGEELDKRAAEYGLHRKQELKATGHINILGNEGVKIFKGTLVSTETGLQYEVNSDIVLNGKEQILDITASNPGSVYNQESGAITKFITPMAGVTITNKEKVQGGTDRESDKELLKRIEDKIQNPSTGGNEADFKNWTLEVEGVTDCKVNSCHYGNGTVKILAIGKDKKPLDEVIIKRILDSIKNKKLVFGKVFVETPKEVPINVSAEIKVENNTFTEEYIRNSFLEEFKKYIKDSVFKRYTVDYYKVISIFYDLLGVTEVKNVTMNGGTSTIKIDENSIQSIGNIDIKLV